MRRLLAVLLILLTASPVFADWSVKNGSYTQTIRGTTIGGSVVQDINIVDGTTGNRATVTSGRLAVDIGGGSISFSGALSAGTNHIGSVSLDGAGNSIGSVGLNVGSNHVGSVTVD